MCSVYFECLSRERLLLGTAFVVRIGKRNSIAGRSNISADVWYAVLCSHQMYGNLITGGTRACKTVGRASGGERGLSSYFYVDTALKHTAASAHGDQNGRYQRWCVSEYADVWCDA